MKKLLLASAAFGAFIAGPAMAADIAPHPVYGPPVVAVPVVSWTGCYLGGNVGYHRSQFGQQLSFDDLPPLPGVEPEWVMTNGLTPSGVTGGYQVGCQVQTGHFVWGIEHDYAWAGASDGRNLVPDPADPDIASFSAKTKSVLTVRGRFGYAEDNAFIYATAGWAGAKFSYSYLLNDAHDDFVSVGSADFTTSGLVVGVGAEYRLAHNWVAGLEWLHYTFGDEKTLPTIPTVGPWGTGGDYINLKTMDVVRARLSYLFSWGAPVAPAIFK
jgi:outer membrane immunogenic protein